MTEGARLCRGSNGDRRIEELGLYPGQTWASICTGLMGQAHREGVGLWGWATGSLPSFDESSSVAESQT
jgi:hypothetical protein